MEPQSQPGIEPGPPHQQHGVLTSRPPGKSPHDRTLRITIKLQSSRPDGTGERSDTEIKGTEQSPKTDPHKLSHLIFDKCAKAIQCRRDGLFNRWRWDN